MTFYIVVIFINLYLYQLNGFHIHFLDLIVNTHLSHIHLIKEILIFKSIE